MNDKDTLTTDNDLVEKLKAAPFYQVYQNAFRSATGLPLVLVPANAETLNPCHGPNQSPLCHALVENGEACAHCLLAQRELYQKAEDHVRTIECFGGLKETAVPVRLGSRTIGYLKTGQVFTGKPTAAQRREFRDALRKAGLSADRIAKLAKLHERTRVILPEQYSGMVTILSAFALQLAAFLNRILLEARPAEPEPVRRARDYIMSHIDEKLTLDEVAAEVHVSTFYFCKLFKQSTGMTFTEFVNRQRIELAKDELLRPDRRVTEIAYDVGYQSLSQFNRSFLKIVGESPTDYRKRIAHSGEVPALVA